MAKDTVYRFAIIFLSLAAFTAATGCTSLAGQGSSKAPGTQPKVSRSKSATGIAKQDQTQAKALNLKQAKADLKSARRKVKLAEFKMELSVLEMKLADYHQKIAETMVRKAEIFKQCRKLEADNKNGRGIKPVDIDKLKALKTKSLALESENIKTRAAMAKIDLNIQELKRVVDWKLNHRPAPPDVKVLR